MPVESVIPSYRGPGLVGGVLVTKGVRVAGGAYGVMLGRGVGVVTLPMSGVRVGVGGGVGGAAMCRSTVSGGLGKVWSVFSTRRQPRVCVVDGPLTMKSREES